MPGVRSWFLFSTTARPRIVPERGLSALSTKSTLPVRVQSVSSASRMRTGFEQSRDDGQRARQEQARIAQVVGLRDVEDEVDGIERDDRGEQGGALLAALDQVAGIDLAVGDAAGNRRAHVGPFEVELGIAQRRPRPT